MGEAANRPPGDELVERGELIELDGQIGAVGLPQGQRRSFDPHEARLHLEHPRGVAPLALRHEHPLRRRRGGCE